MNFIRRECANNYCRRNFINEPIYLSIYSKLKLAGMDTAGVKNSTAFF